VGWTDKQLAELKRCVGAGGARLHRTWLSPGGALPSVCMGDEDIARCIAQLGGRDLSMRDLLCNPYKEVGRDLD